MGLKIIFRILNRIKRNFLVRHFFDFVEIKFNKLLLKKYAGEILKGWSFIIITGGNSDDSLKETVDSIKSEMKDKDYEIIVVGPAIKPQILGGNIVYIKHRGIKFYPGLITLKKNMGALVSKYDKLVICHDYIGFDSGWISGYEKFLEENKKIDVCMNRIEFKDGRRSRDWVAWDFPNVGPALIPYEVNLTKYQYISGTYFVVDREFYIKNPLKENLRWGEGEDVEWSLRIRNKTTFLMNKYSKVKFLRDKSLTDAPYCDNWVENRKKIEEVLKSDYSKINF